VRIGPTKRGLELLVTSPPDSPICRAIGFAWLFQRRRARWGQLLDTWQSVRFDSSPATLYLAVYRPVPSDSRANAERLCAVEERWVAVDIT